MLWTKALLWPEKKPLFSPVLYPMTLPLSISLSALLLREIFIPHHCFIPKSLARWSGQENSDSVNSHSLDLTISLHLRYHLNPDALIPCRKQSCFEMFMGLRKRKNTSCGMFCVFQNSPLNCSLSFSPQATLEVFHGWFPPSGLAKHRGTKISAYWVFSSQNFMLLMLYR